MTYFKRANACHYPALSAGTRCHSPGQVAVCLLSSISSRPVYVGGETREGEWLSWTRPTARPGLLSGPWDLSGFGLVQFRAMTRAGGSVGVRSETWDEEKAVSALEELELLWGL